MSKVHGGPNLAEVRGFQLEGKGKQGNGHKGEVAELRQAGPQSGKAVLESGVINGTGHGSQWAPVSKVEAAQIAESQGTQKQAEVLQTQLASVDGVQVSRQWSADGIDRVVINTGAGNDNVTVTMGPTDNTVLVHVNDEVLTVKLAPDQQLDIRTAGGADVVHVDGSVSQEVVVRGGTGNDFLSASNVGTRIHAGLGNDHISATGVGTTAFGGFGNDTVGTTEAGTTRFNGGAGNDSENLGTNTPSAYSSSQYNEFGLQIEEPRARRKPTLLG